MNPVVDSAAAFVGGLRDPTSGACLNLDAAGFTTVATKNIQEKYFSLLSQNIRSLSQNHDKLVDFLSKINSDGDKDFLFSAVALQETWQI